MGEGDELGAGRKQLPEGVQVHLPARGDGRHHDLGAGPLGDDLPGHDVRMVLQLGQEDLVAGPEVRPAPAFRREVDAFGGAAHEDAAAGGRHAEETGDDLAGALEGDGGLLAEQVDAAVDVRVLLGVIPAERLEDDRRLLRGGGVVEVGQRAAMHGPPEDREVPAKGGDVEGGHARHRRRTGGGRNREATFAQPAGRRTALRMYVGTSTS